MKEKVTAALVQFAPQWLERDKNGERVKDFVEQEAKKGAELIVFPELSNIGMITPKRLGQPPKFRAGISATDFAVMYVKAAEYIPGPTTETIIDVCRKHGVYVVLGMAQLHPTVPATLYNSAVLIGPVGIIGVQHKLHTILNEKQYFVPGNACEVYSTEIGNIGMAICYDNRFPEVSRILALKGAEIICAPYAAGRVSLDLFACPETFKYKAHVRAQENSLYYLLCNRSGQDGDTIFLGHSTISGPNGEILASSESEEEEVVRAELSNEVLIRSRVELTIFRDRRPEIYSPITEPL
jgi:omega-amidase